MHDAQPKPKGEYIPPLVNGDRLTREEFERRYNAMPHVKKAELINGVVYIVATAPPNGALRMSSPVRHRHHGQPHLWLAAWLGHFAGMTPGTDGGDNSTLRLPSIDSETQPDVFLRILPDHGGQSQDSEDGYVAGAPELVAEIASSSVAYDLHDKLELYQRDGVREYLVWRVEDETIDWFILRRGKYKPLPSGSNGIVRSQTFPGLWLDPAAIIRDDYPAWFKVLQDGLASPEHAEFVARLQRKRARKRG